MTDRFSHDTQKLLSEHEEDLLGFALRLGHVLSVHQELVRVAQLKPFVIYHAPMWNMLLSERDMIVVDLASWALGFYEAGGKGFMRTLRGDDREALRLDWKDGESNPHNLEWRKAAFDRLFPKGVEPSKSSKRKGPSDADIEDLCTRLHARFEPLRDDRNQHRAHKYEKGQAKSAAMLSPADVTAHLDACQELLADIRTLSSNSSFNAYRYEAKAHEKDRAAQDVVDLVLLGNINWIVERDPMKGHRDEDQFYWKRREAHYARLHAAHDAARDPLHPFNDRGRFRFSEPHEVDADAS